MPDVVIDSILEAGKRVLRGLVPLAALSIAVAPAPRASAASAASTPSPEEAGRTRIALLPIEDLSGVPAPLRAIRAELAQHLAQHGVEVLPDEALEELLARHRVRWTGGVSRELARAIRDESGAGAVLVSSLDLYVEALPLEIALTSRLVSADDRAEILWMDAVASAGDDAPGFLGLGLVTDAEALRGRALDRLAGSLERYLAGGSRAPRGGGRAGADDRLDWRSRYEPRRANRVPEGSLVGEGRTRVAVIPFINECPAPQGGEIVSLLFLARLAAIRGLEVVEPGVVREALLQARMIQEGGLSLPQVDLLRAMLDVDLVISGRVTDYEEYGGHSGTPVVAFSTGVFDAAKRRIVWTSISHNRGNDGVFFFDAGRIRTAHALASEMAGAAIGRLLGRNPSGRAGPRGSPAPRGGEAR